MNFLEEIKKELNSQGERRSPSRLPPQSGRGSADLVKSAVLNRASASLAHGYHLEFTFDDVTEARNFCDILAQHDIFAKLTTTVENTHFRVYIKNSDCICNLLALVGANRSLLKLSDEIALRSVRNVSNRRANCDTANISKQVSAAQEQIELIKHLKKSGGFARLSEPLRQTATARTNNPDASYEELSQILGITKSGVVHRLQKLMRK